MHTNYNNTHFTFELRWLESSPKKNKAKGIKLVVGWEFNIRFSLAPSFSLPFLWRETLETRLHSFLSFLTPHSSISCDISVLIDIKPITL